MSLDMRTKSHGLMGNFQPDEYLPDTPSIIRDDSGTEPWTPMFHHECSFPPEIFFQVMMNLIRNPNINSSHLFRADILFEEPFTGTMDQNDSFPRILQVDDFDLKTVIVRCLIPRNPLVDKPLDQTCLLYSRTHDQDTESLVIYLPHISSPSEVPFYHPSVEGIAFLHVYNPQSDIGLVSLHYKHFPSIAETQASTLQRTAYHLLRAVHKHGQGCFKGYVKKGQHDTILPQAAVQDTYTRLKTKYAKSLIEKWVEKTDPSKHVFEDLNIAAFLIELWRVMYPEGTEFPRFVDIGCGNGLLVHILLEEGYQGWGFDARRRRSWDMLYPAHVQERLKQLVLVPAILTAGNGETTAAVATNNTPSRDPSIGTDSVGIHNGIFPTGTFIISNHADELTPWTPILASLSSSPFLSIPCCSHNLTGARFRAPPPAKSTGKPASQYSSLVAWVNHIADDCGWEIETEMLRIPSTRNIGLLGRKRRNGFEEVDVKRVVEKYGGAEGWVDNAMKLVKVAARGH